MPAQTLAKAVEHVFSDAFLFNRDNRVWRDMVVDRDGNPEDVPATAVATFTDVAAALDGTQSTSDIGDRLAAALKRSKAVTVGQDASGNVVLARSAPLAVDEDPDLRTVAVKPVPNEASDEDISSFFQTYGTVAGVQRSQYLAGDAVRPITYVTFATREEAAKCVAAKPAFGSCGSALGDRFLPRLTVVAKHTFMTQQSERVQRGAAARLRSEISGATEAAPAATKHRTDGAGPGKNTSPLSNPTPGCTVKVHRPNGDWKEVKIKLGNLVLYFPELRRGWDSVIPNKAGDAMFVVCRTAHIATRLAAAHNEVALQSEKLAAALHEIVPQVTVLGGAEEEGFLKALKQAVAAAGPNGRVTAVHC